MRTTATSVLGAAAFAVVAIAGPAATQDRAPWGTPEDVAFAEALWPMLERQRLVGDERIQAFPIAGDPPHGQAQQIVASMMTMDGRVMRLVVKANHRGDGVTPAKAYEDPSRWLSGYAVMIRREPGYDPRNHDWFWVAYTPDGGILRHQGTPVAGRVDTGSSDGCIGCHVKKGGGDLEVMTPR